MIKDFMSMMEVDVSRYVKELDGIRYLPWAACLLLLHENGAQDVVFYPIPGPDGSTLRCSEREFADKNGLINMCYEVVIHIKIDDLEWEITYPVLKGNNSVTDNSMNQLLVNNAVRRGFVKGVAERTGLGFSLWLNDEDSPDDDWEDLSKHSLRKCRQRMQELITTKINSGIPLNIIADRLGRTEDEVKSMIGWYTILAKAEKAISEMMP